ncbi:MAG: NAD(P)H-dependent glycerol-3-phosphate dehydrogenase [Lentisphaeria bacterium]
MKITVLGDGAWGTALALVALQNKHEVRLWGAFPDYIDRMRQTRRNEQFMPGVALPDELTLEADLAAAVKDVELVIGAVPVQYMRGMLELARAVNFPADAVYVNVGKGIELDSLMRPSQLVFEYLGGGTQYIALSGPSHAEEVVKHVPTAVVVAGTRPASAAKVQQALMNDSFRIYTSEDVTGVELGGALKNVYAVAAGICDGMGLGDNSKAAMITRAIAEMGRLGKALGGAPETFAGLSGVGDLIVTCVSRHSRNRHVGEALGQGRKLDEIQAEMGKTVAEGVKTTKSASELARSKNVSTPIIDEVYATLYEGKDPRQAVQDLMRREPKPENPVA